MAFVYKAKRFGEKEIDDAQLGPGEYITHKPYTVPHGYAPFGSLVDRDQPLKKEVTTF